MLHCWAERHSPTELVRHTSGSNKENRQKRSNQAKGAPPHILYHLLSIFNGGTQNIHTLQDLWRQSTGEHGINYVHILCNYTRKRPSLVTPIFLRKRSHVADWVVRQSFRDTYPFEIVLPSAGTHLDTWFMKWNSHTEDRRKIQDNFRAFLLLVTPPVMEFCIFFVNGQLLFAWEDNFTFLQPGIHQRPIATSISSSHLRRRGLWIFHTTKMLTDQKVGQISVVVGVPRTKILNFSTQKIFMRPWLLSG